MRTEMLAGGLLAALLWVNVGAAEEAKTESARPAGDEQGIQSAVAAFTRAFNAGDAPAIAKLFTEDAQIFQDDGDVIRGRKAIESEFAASFERDPGATIAIKPTSLRFLTPDVAQEDGVASLKEPSEGGRTESGRYSVIYVKRDGQWLQNSVHELAEPAVASEDRLKELEWMLGEWVDEGDDSIVHVSCKWSDNKNFLLREFAIHRNGKPEMSGSQRIGWDPRSRQIRSWAFDSRGQCLEGLWSRSGDEWIVKDTGYDGDGETLTSTHFIKRVNAHTSHWKSVDRTRGGDVLPDIDEVVLVKKPPQPK